MPFRSITPNINVNTDSGQLRTELLNTFTRLDGQLSSVPYTYYSVNGPVSNTGATETNLFQKTMETGTLPTLGDSILITAIGSTNISANNKSIRFYLGNTLIFDSGPQTFNNISWILRGEIIRNGGASEVVYFELVTSDTTYRSTVQVTVQNKDLALNQALTLSAIGGASGDVTCNYLKMLLLSH